MRLSRSRTGAFTSKRSTGRSCTGTAAGRPNTAPGVKLAIERGWLWLHESGAFVKFTDAGAALFA
jgi:hypothetical protein